MNHAALVAVIAMLSTKADPVDPEELAEAIEIETTDRDLAALLVAVAIKESAGSARIARGECKPWECDSIRERLPGSHEVTIRFRAWGLFQERQNANNRKVWGSRDLFVQAHSASRHLRGGLGHCAKELGMPHSPELRVVLALNGYAGLRCDAEWPGLNARVAVWRTVRARL